MNTKSAPFFVRGDARKPFTSIVRIGFKNDGYDCFINWALNDIRITDHVVINDLDARMDEKSDQWIISAEKK